MKLPFRSLLLVSLATAALAQPSLTAVQNNYSYILPGLPNYGIAQGSIFVLFGANLATTPTGLQGAPLRPAVEGVSVAVTVSGQTRAALIYYVTPTQIAGILPSTTPTGTGTITVAPELVWTNRASLDTVDRTTPITLTWSGGEPTTLVTIEGLSTIIQGSSALSASFQCWAKNTDGRFTVPSSVLLSLPASGRTVITPTFSLLQRGSLAIATVGRGTRIRPTGLDYGTLGSQYGVAQSTVWK